MKYKIFLISVFAVVALSTHAQIKEKTQFIPPTVQHLIPNVQKVDIGVDSLKNNGEIYFSAVITSTGRGMVCYQWILTAQQTGLNTPMPAVKKDSILLSGSGIDKVYKAVRKINNSSTAIRLETLTPNVVLSNVEHY